MPAIQFDPRDVVAAKRDGGDVDPERLRAFVLGYARGEIPDSVAAAFLMAAYIKGLSPEETAEMTRAMVESGRTIALSSVARPKVDKHSTGGVSDGVTLVFAPLAASLGLAVAKLSGRGLGHTGGTLDKLESIPGFRTELSPEQLERQVAAIGCAVAGQTADLVPADGALYSLRDATATVSSTPLIAASVMSKKLAVNTDLILLDVKAGSGAFMKTPQAASDLAEACVRLASAWGRRARAAVTDMGQPLGTMVGNALEVAECVGVLRGEERGRLRQLAVLFAGEALAILEAETPERGRAAAERSLDDGSAAGSFAEMVRAQGGDASVVDDPWKALPRAPYQTAMTLSEDGWVASIDAEAVGRAAVVLGAGRVAKGDPVDPAVGIEFRTSVGDRVNDGDVVAVVHHRDRGQVDRAGAMIRGAVKLASRRIEPPPLVYGWHDSAPPAESGAPKGADT